MFSTDLTDEQWIVLQPLLITRIGSGPKGGRPLKQDVRQEVNGILYLLKTGCQWRMLPPQFGHWAKVYARFRRWRLSGQWDHALAVLREQQRKQSGRQSTPSVAIIDSQSVKTTLKGLNAAMTPAKRSRVASAI